MVKNAIFYVWTIAPLPGRTGAVIKHLFCPKQLVDQLGSLKCEGWETLKEGQKMTVKYGSGMTLTIERQVPNVW
jgi:hypothetical protein